MTTCARTTIVLLTVVMGMAVQARAQAAPPVAPRSNPVRVEAEFAAGGAWFLDESPVRHVLAGGSARFWLTPRLAIGPEYAYWVGPADDRDQTLSGNLTFAFREAGLTPFLVGGGGIYRHSDRFGTRT